MGLDKSLKGHSKYKEKIKHMATLFMGKRQFVKKKKNPFGAFQKKSKNTSKKVKTQISSDSLLSLLFNLNLMNRTNLPCESPIMYCDKRECKKHTSLSMRPKQEIVLTHNNGLHNPFFLSVCLCHLAITHITQSRE